ncbi:hypothetical protein FJ960_28125 [Mesorhizobium sp. B2-3-11]|uniref:hypothetical protein n=1 Tax=Mesorhizobium sp. B2-3-11 TaxID=2589953 RepID=UPI001128D936|nr:hypothetical protein [Mesorhizobium sp. B2-3-11]TPL94276.1 hypothetical protein FJ960_28125 [Mesorhizobium sp. B2-3-11]
MSLKVDFPVMANMANICLDMFPQLGEVRILRHWAGGRVDAMPLSSEPNIHRQRGVMGPGAISVATSISCLKGRPPAAFR